MVCRAAWKQTQSAPGPALGLRYGSLGEQFLDLFRYNLLEPLCAWSRARLD